MLIAEKANRRVRINDEKKDEYIGMGYIIKNTDGSLVKAPDNPKKRVQELESEIATLKAENADLKGKVEEAEKYAENADKRIAELEAELKKAAAGSESSKKEPKTKQTDK